MNDESKRSAVMVSVPYTLQQITLTHFPMLQHTKKRKKKKKVIQRHGFGFFCKLVFLCKAFFTLLFFYYFPPPHLVTFILGSFSLRKLIMYMCLIIINLLLYMFIVLFSLSFLFFICYAYEDNK